jgi:hypothetical protein
MGRSAGTGVDAGATSNREGSTSGLRKSLNSELKADDGRWEGEGIMNGQKMEFHADPRTGVITSEKLDD